MFVQVPKKAAKSEKRPVLGSKLSTYRTISSSTSNGSKTQSVQLKNSTKSQPVRNTLDSTAPTIKRGKEREKPKKKRPTKMRKIIAAERATRVRIENLNFPDNGTLIYNANNSVGLEHEVTCVKNLPDVKSSNDIVIQYALFSIYANEKSILTIKP